MQSALSGEPISRFIIDMQDCATSHQLRGSSQVVCLYNDHRTRPLQGSPGCASGLWAAILHAPRDKNGNYKHHLALFQAEPKTNSNSTQDISYSVPKTCLNLCEVDLLPTHDGFIFITGLQQLGYKHSFDRKTSTFTMLATFGISDLFSSIRLFEFTV